MLTGIENHPEFATLLESVELAGTRTKKELVNILYFQLEKDWTKKKLGTLNKGKLIALLVNHDFGGIFNN
ncbi:hypothetical protein KAR91_84740 [Candidatus Pacearchaeota archaeon]|nr:hypothetical protein [Candidatus Pacearchaeota archaeon]